MNTLNNVLNTAGDNMDRVLNFRLYSNNEDGTRTYWGSMKQYPSGYTVRADRRAVARKLTADEAREQLMRVARRTDTVNVEVNGFANGERQVNRVENVAVPMVTVKGPFRDGNGKFVSRQRAAELGLI